VTKEEGNETNAPVYIQAINGHAPNFILFAVSGNSKNLNLNPKKTPFQKQHLIK
jgi:hypothetical protein